MAKKPRHHETQELFGGVWTQKKLESVQKYLRAYCQIFKPGSKGGYYRTIYVDAFAGSGYMRQPEMPLAEAFPEEFIELSRQAEEYSKGSAIRALEIEPGFSQYLFIERKKKRAAELQKIIDANPKKDAQVVVADANDEIIAWCERTDWKANRAVVFLDPFGMQVRWKTLKVMAATRAVDVWILFPIFGVNRMLVRHGRPRKSWSTKLDEVFGTPEWEAEFYSVTKSTLIEGVELTEKTADLGKIADFFVTRLRSIFAAVSEPRVLHSNRGPLFLLVFAASNVAKAPLAMKIAQHILGS
jgi:three-Cys-motif partner protein